MGVRYCAQVQPAHIAKMTPAELRAWKNRHGLTMPELAWIFQRSERTIYRKLSGETRIVAIKDKIEVIEGRLAQGKRPDRWPPDLPPNPTEIRRRQRRRKFSTIVVSQGFVQTLPKCQGSGQLSAPI